MGGEQPQFAVAYDRIQPEEKMVKASDPQELLLQGARGGVGLTSPQPEGMVTESFDVVIIAHALERSGLEVGGCAAAPLESPGSCRRCTTHFVKGALRPVYFGTSTRPPLEVLT